MGHERRFLPRIAGSWWVQLSSVNQQQRGLCLNLSEQGAEICLERPITQGSTGTLSIDAPVFGPLLTLAEVVRYDASTGTAGIRFISIAATARDALRRFVRASLPEERTEVRRQGEPRS